MNKKVLSAILFSALFAGTGTFTSCIDNDEPAGIEELRGAKAELLRAKVAVEQAEAAHKLALAEVEKANAAIRSAVAKQEEATAKLMEAQAEAEQATTAQAKAEAEQAIAEAKNAMAEAALEHEANMVDLQKSLAIAKRQYELTLAQIEIAKQLFPFETYIELSKLQDDVEDAQEEVDEAAELLAEKKAEYDAAAIDYKYKGEIQKKRLENAVAKKEGLLAAAKEELAKWEGFLENDVETADWRAEVDSLDALVKSMAKENSKLTLEISKLTNSDEYKALQDSALLASVPATVDTVYGYKYFGKEYATAFYGTETATDTVNALSDGSIEISAEAAMLAQVEYAKSQIAVYNDDDVLVDGILYDDKSELASFTAETQHFLDTIAAEAAGDTTLLGESNAAVKAWEAALKAYNEADTTMTAELDTLTNGTYGALKAWNDKSAAEKKAKNIDALRKALLDYYTAAKNNGAEFNKLLTKVDSVSVTTNLGNGITQTVKNEAFDVVDLFTILADTVKTYYAFVKLPEEATAAQTGISTPISVLNNVNVAGESTYAITKYDATSKANKAFSASLNPMKTAPTTVGSSTDAPYLTTTYLGKLQNASKDAFGVATQYLKNLPSGMVYTHASNYYLHVMPDTADIKNLDTYTVATKTSLGKFGAYVLATDGKTVEYAKNYKSIMANLEGAITYWEAAYEALDAIYVEWEEAKDAAADKVKTYYIENIQVLSDQQAVLTERAGRINSVISALKSAIQTYLEPELKGTSDYTNVGILQAKQTFKERLQKLAEGALEDVEEAEDNLADAQIALEKNGDEDSSYNLLEAAKVAYEEAQAKLDEAQAKLDEALANLAKGLEILGVSAE